MNWGGPLTGLYRALQRGFGLIQARNLTKSPTYNQRFLNRACLACLSSPFCELPRISTVRRPLATEGAWAKEGADGPAPCFTEVAAVSMLLQDGTVTRQYAYGKVRPRVPKPLFLHFAVTDDPRFLSDSLHPPKEPA